MVDVMGEGLTGLVFGHNVYYKLISALQTKNNRIYYIFTLVYYFTCVCEFTWVVALANKILDKMKSNSYLFI